MFGRNNKMMMVAKRIVILRHHATPLSSPRWIIDRQVLVVDRSNQKTPQHDTRGKAD